MKNHWQTTKFLPFQKIFSVKLLNLFSLQYHKLMGIIIDRYEVNEPTNIKGRVNQTALLNQATEVLGFRPNNIHVINQANSFGNYFEDADGNQILDLHMDNGFNVLGYNHRIIVRNSKLEKFQRFSINKFSNTPAIEYSSKVFRVLHKSAPKELDEVILTKNHKAALNQAIDLAYYSSLEKDLEIKNKKTRVIEFDGSDSSLKDTIKLKFPDLKFPYEQHLESNLEAENESLFAIKQKIDEIKAEGKEIITSLIIEPIRFKAGVYYASPAYYRGLLRLLKENQITSIIDETYTGGWATGRMFTYYSWCSEIQPDAVVFGGRMQISGVFYQRSLVGSLEELQTKANIEIKINSTVDLLQFQKFSLLKEIVYEVDWLDLHTNNFASSIRTEFNEIQSKSFVDYQNVRGKGKIIAFDVAHTILRDEIVCLALRKGIKLGYLGDRTIIITPSLLFTEIHFTPIKEFLISVVPSTNHMSKI